MRLDCVLCVLFVGAFATTQAVFNVVDLQDRLTSDVFLETQAVAVNDLIARTVGPLWSRNFTATLNPLLDFHSFKLSKCTPYSVCIEGSDGVSAAKGFHHYLKYHLMQDITWTRTDISGRLPLTAELPNVTLTAQSLGYTYYQNVCTWGYSFVWWSWDMWQRHIDWMAMMGIRITLAPVQEFIWRLVYTDMGLRDEEISEHFAGPAFQPWQRMGNIRGWGGPLPDSYRTSQMRLQLRILERQRRFGMVVALPAFAGHLPRAVQRLYANVTFTPVERWNKFPDAYCCDLFLDPTEPLFAEIAGRFLQKAITLYGSDHLYFADPFNEVQPRKAEASYLRQTAQSIYHSMLAVDPEASWLLQGWMFVKNPFWSAELMRSFLEAVPTGRLLVLDLQSEQFPQYERTDSFYGQPFVWCMLHNFGGTLGMHGSAEIVNSRVKQAWQMANSSMIGVGITPEGIHQNYAMYALALERSWLARGEEFDLRQWFTHYADVRYGLPGNEALRASWQLLKDSVYSFHSLRRLRGKYTVTRRPSFTIDTWTWYDPAAVREALRLLLTADSLIGDPYYEQYEHDVVDLTRQFLQSMADRLYVNLKLAFKGSDSEAFSYLAKQLMGLFVDLEQLLGTHASFMLGPWLESAKRLAETPLERDLYEMNARNQITAWGPDGQILDYACKQWSGLVRDYYAPRWGLFLGMAEKSLATNTSFPARLYQQRVSQEIELPFSWQKRVYPEEPASKRAACGEAKRILDKWTGLEGSSQYQQYARRRVRILTGDAAERSSRKRKNAKGGKKNSLEKREKRLGAIQT